MGMESEAPEEIPMPVKHETEVIKITPPQRARSCLRPGFLISAIIFKEHFIKQLLPSFSSWWFETFFIFASTWGK